MGKFLKASVFFVFIAMGSFSCLPVSIYPAHNQSQIIVDKSLIGTWALGTPDSIRSISEVSWFDSNTYLITVKNNGSNVLREFKQDSNYTFSYLGQLTEIDGHLILSYTTALPEYNVTENPASMFFKGYDFLKISKKNPDSIMVNMLNYEVLQKNLTKPFSGVKKIELNEYFIIVDYPEKVRKFIRKCLRSKDIFYFERELLKKPALVFWRFHNNQQ